MIRVRMNDAIKESDEFSRARTHGFLIAPYLGSWIVDSDIHRDKQVKKLSSRGFLIFLTSELFASAS